MYIAPINLFLVIWPIYDYHSIQFKWLLSLSLLFVFYVGSTHDKRYTT